MNVRSSYKKEDVVLLLKDITGMVEPLSTEVREKLIQNGKHYSEMLPIEYVPSKQYITVYQEVLKVYAKPVALAVAQLADKIIEKKGKKVVLVSLVRAGVPVGILIKRFIYKKYNINIPHFAISIIRGRGIDDNAMQYLLKHYDPEQLLFVDGWIGKGAILKELKKNIAAYKGVSDDIAVLADPANMTELCGTHEDILIPSACLNSTVSGLISRSFLRNDIIGKNDFHGAVYYQDLEGVDHSYAFIESIEKEFVNVDSLAKEIGKDKRTRNDVISHKDTNHSGEVETGMIEAVLIAKAFSMKDINLIKPGIGETTRVLLRRVPWKILIDERYEQDPQLKHLLQLAEEKNVPIVHYPLTHYKCCGIISQLADT